MLFSLSFSLFYSYKFSSACLFYLSFSPFSISRTFCLAFYL